MLAAGSCSPASYTPTMEVSVAKKKYYYVKVANIFVYKVTS